MDPTGHIHWLVDLGNQFLIVGALADRHAQLMGAVDGRS